MKPLAIYVHIPFCKARCYYCSFVSSLYSLDRVSKYFDALLREIDLFDFSGFVVNSIYFGGGTPSVVKQENILTVLDLIKKKAFISAEAEITIECNPESFSREKAMSYKKAGINRISFGLQSTDDKILKRIGRIHTYNVFLEACSIAKEYFSNISADLIIGLPGQDKRSLKTDLERVVSLGIEHISIYGLKVEEGTLLQKEGYKVDEDLTADLYSNAVDYLAGKGFIRYEVSNFSKEDKYRSRHNFTYWNRGDYVGFGLSAHSFINNYRIENTCSYIDYIEGKTECKRSFISPLESEAAEETIMLALRTSDGLDIKSFNEKFNRDLLSEKSSQLKQLEKFLKVEDNRLKLKDDGFYVMNEIIVRLL